MSVMSTIDLSNNGVNGTGSRNDEDSSPGRCLMDGPGRNPVTARMKWNKAINIAVMECYYLSNPMDENNKPVKGYRQRMHRIWNERETFKCSEQRLCDQARAIRKNEWLTLVELEEIKRRVLQEEEQEVDLTEERNVNDADNVEEVEPEEVEIEIAGGEVDMNEEQTEIVDSIVNMMKEDNVEAPKGFKKIERSKLDQEIKRVNQAIDFIQTSTISDTNRLIAAVATYVGQKVGLKVKENRPERNKEPFWKRRIRKKVNEIRKHINILERYKRNEIRNKEKYNNLEHKYQIKKKGLNTVIEELKQRLSAKAAKIRRYEQRIEQYKQNRMFRYDQKKVYQDLNGENRKQEVKPDAQQSTAFWKDIWGNEKHHNRNAEWLNDLKVEQQGEQQENIEITENLIRQQCKKIPNWKAPGPDGVQGYWIKKLTSLHGRIACQMDDMINNRIPVPSWMTQGRTVLCQKDHSKGNAVDNYRPISCLPLMWKLLTGVIAEYA